LDPYASNVDDSPKTKVQLTFGTANMPSFSGEPMLILYDTNGVDGARKRKIGQTDLDDDGIEHFIVVDYQFEI